MIRPQDGRALSNPGPDDYATHCIGRNWRLAAAVAIVCSLVLVAVSVGGSWRIQRFQNSDTFIFSLSSTQMWTPFFWGQDRLGMLFPLLAKPVADPLWNMVVQNIMMCLCGLASLVLLGWYFTDFWLGAVAGLTVWLMAVWDEWLAFDSLVAHPEYLAALCLALTGMLVLAGGASGRQRPPGALRLVCGAIFVLLGCWVNVALAALMIPLAIGRHLCGPSRQASPMAPADPVGRWPWRTFRGPGAGCAWSVVLLSASSAAIAAMAGAMKLPHTATAIVPWAQWPNAWGALFESVANRALGPLLRWLSWPISTSQCFAILLGGLVTACVVLGTRVRRSSLGREALGRAWRVALAQALPAVLLFLLVGTSQHVRLYASGFRYTMLTVFLLACGLVSFLVVLAAPFLGKRRVLVGGAVLALLLALTSLFKYGLPNEQKILREWDSVTSAGQLGPRARDVIRTGCTHVGGLPGNTWDTTFYTNLLLYRSGSTRQVYGWTDRAGQTHCLWDTMPREKILLGCVERDWREAVGGMHDWYGFPAIDQAAVIKTPFIEVHACSMANGR